MGGEAKAPVLCVGQGLASSQWPPWPAVGGSLGAMGMTLQRFLSPSPVLAGRQMDGLLRSGFWICLLSLQDSQVWEEKPPIFLPW